MVPGNEIGRPSIDLAASVMVGDRSSDVEAGRAAGCKTVFIDLGYVSELKPASPDVTVRSIAEATDAILGVMPTTGERGCVE